MTEEISDVECAELLRLLHKYVVSYAPDIPQTISAFAEDLAMSQDVTSNESDRYRREIEEALYGG
jgi:hypothetical protein